MRGFGATVIGIAIATASLAGCSSNPVTPAAGVPSSIQPQAKAAKSAVFIADATANVTAYSADIHLQDPPPLFQITSGVSRSTGVWVDAKGTVYVLNSGGSSINVVEYQRGTSTPFKTITQGLGSPSSIAVDNEGTLYVDEVASGGTLVAVYPKGAATPSKTIALPAQGRAEPGEMALSPNGTLLVDTADVENETASVYAIARGGSKAKNLHLHNALGPSLGCDAAGNIYTGQPQGNILVYAPGATQATRSISVGTTGFYSNMSVAADGTIYWANYDSTQMYEVAPGGSQPVNVFPTEYSGVAAAAGPI